MRAFILMCVLATALAAPQGYNYPQQTTGLNTANTGSIGVNTINHAAPTFLQDALRNTQLMQTLLNSNQNAQHTQVHHGHTSTINVPNTFYQPPLRTQQELGLRTFNTAQSQFNAARQTTPVITKDIYVHVAPEEPADTFVSGAALPPPPPRKHYRIVFIKAPAQNLASGAALRVKQAPVEEKTIIYVLTKKTDPLDLQQAIQEAAPKQPSKPEVYFIKYKTQEEAQHAQRTIQAQYDQLGGTTQISDEGFAPVTSVIGALDQQSGGQVQPQNQPGVGTITTTNINTSSSGTALFTSNVNSGATNQYLPPVKRH